jgi:hypothetical protein
MVEKEETESCMGESKWDPHEMTVHRCQRRDERMTGHSSSVQTEKVRIKDQFITPETSFTAKR